MMRSFNVRDVVDMDVALHGRAFIVTEFAVVAALAAVIAGIEIHINVPTALYATVIALNCATFTVLAATRRRVAAPGLPSVYWLTFLALGLLFIPLVFPVAALQQRSEQ